MKKIERQEQEMMEYLKIAKRASLEDAINLLRVSESTVRRLFNRLESDGRALRYYGGIQLAVENKMEYSYEQVEARNVEQKMAIADKAVTAVETGDILYLDSGTTMAHFSMALARRLERQELTNLTVFTNSLVNLNILEKYITINLIGGEYRMHRKDFCGYIAEETVKSLHFTKCFLGADGYSVQNGCMTTDFYTARLNEIALNNAETHIVLIDSSKFFTTTVVSYSKASHIDRIYTDALPSPAVAAKLEKDGTRLIMPNAPD